MAAAFAATSHRRGIRRRLRARVRLVSMLTTSIKLTRSCRPKASGSCSDRHGGGVRSDQPPAGDPSKTAGACSIGFNVDDVDKTYEELQAKGIRFVMPPTQREGEGIKLAVGLDPDGLPISFAQLIQHGG